MNKPIPSPALTIAHGAFTLGVIRDQISKGLAISHDELHRAREILHAAERAMNACAA